MKTRWLALALIATVCGVMTAAHAEWSADITSVPISASIGPGGTITYDVLIENDYSESLTLSFGSVSFSSPQPDGVTYGTWSQNSYLYPGPPGGVVIDAKSSRSVELGTWRWHSNTPLLETVTGTLTIYPLNADPAPRDTQFAQPAGSFRTADDWPPSPLTKTFTAKCAGPAVVPEPSSLLLLGVGIVSMLALHAARRGGAARRKLTPLGR